MSEEDSFAAFHSDLSTEIGDRASGDSDGAEFRENAFVEIVSEHLAEIGMLEDPEICYHEGRLGNAIVRLNGYAVSDDGERLDLLVALFKDEPTVARVSAEEIDRLAVQAVRALTFARRNGHESMEKASDAYAMMRRISECLASGVTEVRVFVLTDGLSGGREIKAPVDPGMKLSFEVYDLRRLMRTMTSGQTREVIDISLAAFGIDPIPCVAMPSHGENYQTYLAIVPGQALFRMYEEFGSRLLEYNVRAFLQASGKVNRGIRDTLRDEPQHFMAYNNGISVTVDQIQTRMEPDQGLVITHLKGMQIVNGGQTTASIHRARQREGLDLARVHVPAKITCLPADRVEQMVPKISRFANTQNVIQEADFSSNEPFHVALDRLSKSVWCPGERSRWFYERARGQYTTAMNLEGKTPAQMRAFRERTPAAQKFSKTDVARSLNSWNRLPHVVSTGAQKNFVAFMRNLRATRGSAWEPDEGYYRDLVSKTILFKAVAKIVKQEAFPAYRANIVVYLISYLSHRCGGQLDTESIWKAQAVSSELVATLRSWARPILECIQKSASGRNVTEWCKKEDCWAAVKLIDLPMTGQIVELTVRPDHQAAEASLTEDQRSSAAECMKYSAEQWFAIHLWGKRTGLLADWQAGIAHTLSSYASGGWQRVPSAKQALQAMKILELARVGGCEAVAGTRP